MNILYHLGVGLLIVIAQSTVFGLFLPQYRLFDHLIPFVVYVGLFASRREGLIVAPFVGMVVDFFSAGPVGVFLFAYFWVFLVARWTPIYFHSENPLVLSVLCGVGVCIEKVFLSVTSVLIGRIHPVSGMVS
ncbi:hypothetical protein ACFL0Q_04930, partial [Thermodesulfobacteriota bacterium]